MQEPPFEEEEALFDKSRLLFPVAVFASRIANRVLLAFCDAAMFATGKLAVSAQPRTGHILSARCIPHSGRSRTSPLFCPFGQKIHPLLRKNLQKRGWAIHSEWNRVSGFDLLGSGILSLRLAGAIHLPRQREAFVMRDIASKNGTQERGAARQT